MELRYTFNFEKSFLSFQFRLSTDHRVEIFKLKNTLNEIKKKCKPQQKDLLEVLMA